MKARTIGIVLGMMVLIAPQFAVAMVTFDRLTEDIYVVSHRVKLIGGRGQAMRVLYDKAGSLCVAAGYTHFEILDQVSQAWQHEEAANASVRVRFFLESGDERIDCSTTGSDKYIEQAATKLKKNGYRPPSLPASRPAEMTDGIGSCSTEQISAMERVGLSADQVDAACKK